MTAAVDSPAARLKSALPLNQPSPLVLLGEVHDNARQHALRLQALDALLAAGARPALLMEQFDRERQADIDRVREAARAAGTPLDADSLIDAAKTPSARWQWAFYRPLIARALEHGLPIVAANVSRGDARRVMTHGLAAGGFDADVPGDIIEKQAALIVQSHCGLVDAEQGRRMAAAQVARDQQMARLVERWRDRGVVLLAGNGHVRRDIGVPRWLSDAATRERTVAIGLLEPGDTGHAAFDRAVTTADQARADPCKPMRRPAPAAR